eukprot:sb/3478379/
MTKGDSRFTKEVIQAGIKDGAEGATRGTKDSGMRVARGGQTRGLSEYGRSLPGRRVFTEHCSVGGRGTEAQTAVSYTTVERERSKSDEGFRDSGTMRISTS